MKEADCGRAGRVRACQVEDLERKIGIADQSHLEREERAAKAERLEGRCLSDKDEKRET